MTGQKQALIKGVCCFGRMRGGEIDRRLLRVLNCSTWNPRWATDTTGTQRVM